MGCTGLASVAIPSGITQIQDGTFESTGLTNMTIPDGVAAIGQPLDCQSLSGRDLSEQDLIPQSAIDHLVRRRVRRRLDKGGHFSGTVVHFAAFPCVLPRHLLASLAAS